MGREPQLTTRQLEVLLLLSNGRSTAEIATELGLSTTTVRNYIANLLVKYPCITWIGLLIILWVALGMVYQGSHEVTCKAFNFGCSETLWQGIMHRLAPT